MSVRRAVPAVVSAVAMFLLPAIGIAQDDMAQEAMPNQAAMIENALSAGPPAIAAEAAVADFEGNVLREGTNDYTCLPDNPDTPGNSPMCLDGDWLAWAQAWMAGEDPPAPADISFAYMLQGDFPLSNVDPAATEPTPDNEWITNSGPHVMMLVPDASMLEGIPTDPSNGGPWVMWGDTPYAHVMIPLEDVQR